MSTADSGLDIDDWASENLDKDVGYDAEKNNSRSDSEKKEPRFESESPEGAPESKNGNFKFESDESDAESERSQTNCDYEHINQDDDMGSSDVQTDTSISGYNGLPGCEVNIRRRGQLDAETEKISLDYRSNESVRQGQLQTEHLITSSRPANSQLEGTARDIIPASDTNPTTHKATSTASVWNWFMYFAPKTLCIVALSFVYLGLAILSIKMLHLSTKKD